MVQVKERPFAGVESGLEVWLYDARRCYFEWLEGEFVDCEATLQGRNLHRRLEMEPDNLAEFGLGPIHAREIALIGPYAGITCWLAEISIYL